MTELNRDDHPFVNDLRVGDSFDGYFVLQRLQMKSTRANKPFLVFEFSDRTGRIMGKLWDDAEAAYHSLKEEQVVKVRALVEEYLGNPELKVQKIRSIAPEDSTDTTRFLPTVDHDSVEDWDQLEAAMERMEHPGLKALLEKLFTDEAFRERYGRVPAGKRWHHEYIGGLLEHAASMAKLAHRVADHYPKLNRDLLVAGAILHDIGKLQELKYGTSIDYTVKGRLEGHLVLGAQFIEENAKGIEGLDEETLVHLKHLILSHQGTHENGCPVEPMTREAFVLYYLDEIDSKMNAINRELEKAAGGGGAFTEYIRLLNRMLYKGGGFENPDQETGASED
ncbi:MAG: HD domain-containing protein [bacterium]